MKKRKHIPAEIGLPTKHRPGSREKIELMRQRVEHGIPPHNHMDAGAKDRWTLTHSNSGLCGESQQRSLPHVHRVMCSGILRSAVRASDAA